MNTDDIPDFVFLQSFNPYSIICDLAVLRLSPGPKTIKCREPFLGLKDYNPSVTVWWRESKYSKSWKTVIRLVPMVAVP